MRKNTVAAFIAGAGVAIAVVFAVIGTIAFADTHQDEVRVQARQLADGRVEVAVQQRSGPDADWGERISPDLRILSADAPAGRWFSSSPVAARPMVEEAAAAEPQLFCLVTHAHPDDPFWWIPEFAASEIRWPRDLPGIDVRMSGSPDVAEQSQLIRDCVADGAVAIGVTLADPDGLAEAIGEAADAGVWIVTFNSGDEDYKRVRSSRHVGVAEAYAGGLAAERIIATGVEGPALCIIHERRNVGLEERCDGFEDAWPGPVERLHVEETGFTDVAGTAAAIADRLRGADEPFAAVLTLNYAIAPAAVDAIADAESDAVLATFDVSTDTLLEILDGNILFALETSPFSQTWLALSAMRHLVVSGTGIKNDWGDDDAVTALGHHAILIQPHVYTPENSQQVYDLLVKIYAARDTATEE